MKTSHPKSTIGEGEQLSPPRWVSYVGLEWLYRLLVQGSKTQRRS